MTEQPPASGEAILYREEDGVAWTPLNRPDRLNAFAGTMRDDLRAAVERAAASAGVRVAVITGAGRAFCAGADVEVMQELLARGDGATFEGYVEAGPRAAHAIRPCRKAGVAAGDWGAAGAGGAP